MYKSPEEERQHQDACSIKEPVLQVDLIHVYYHDGVRRKVFLCPLTGKVLICEEDIAGNWVEIDG